ncbi:MAG: histidine kinase [bacterium]
MDDDSLEFLEKQLGALEARLRDRQVALPAHSIRPHQLIELEELEEEVARIRQRLTDHEKKA